MDQITTLANGLTLFNDSFWRGWGAVLGLIPLHNVPVVVTDANALLDAIDKSGGFGFGVMRNINPPFYQKQIDGVTRSPWGHAVMLIGEEIGKLARIEKPDLMEKKLSPRWLMDYNRQIIRAVDMDRGRKTSPRYIANHAGAIPQVEGIDPHPSKFEIVESKAVVVVSDLTKAIEAGEQVVIFTNTNWTLDQKIKMAIEAYSWVGEPYDIWEIGNYIIPFIPNPAKLKVCSSLIAQIITASGPVIRLWCVRHRLDIEKLSPRDIFAYGSDGIWFDNHCFRCNYDEILDMKV